LRFMIALLHEIWLLLVESNSNRVFPHQTRRFLSLPPNRP
jgi:hypothetical protein